MSSVKALKRKSQKQQIVNNKEKTAANNFFSCPNLHNPQHIQADKKSSKLRRTNSLPDLTKTSIESKKFPKINAKSERNLNVLYNFTSSTPHSTMVSSSVSSPTRNSSNLMEVSSYSVISDNEQIKIPIIGYEIMEERSRFTIFKLRIENYEKNNFWLVLRRFTDFTRLHAKLKSQFPKATLVLPKKNKWFGNNFNSGFLDSRIAGLQTFINSILSNNEMKKSPAVREFFCLDDPPNFSESMEDCKVIFEAQEETIAHLKMQLKAKDETIANLMRDLVIKKQQNEYLRSFIK